MKSAPEKGFALLIVLWSLVLLSLILSQLLSAGRSESQLAANLRASATAEAAADGAVQEAVFHLLANGGQHWQSGSTHRLRIGQSVADVTIESAADKINPNTASPELLRAAIAMCDTPAATASSVAQSIVAWRSADTTTGGADPAALYRAAGLGYAPPGLPLQTLDELGLVVGMTPALLDCLRPHLSLYQEGGPSPHSGDALVVRALATLARQGVDTMTGAEPSQQGAVTITALAAGPAGGHFVRRATVRLARGDDGRPYRILTWETPSAG